MALPQVSTALPPSDGDLHRAGPEAAADLGEQPAGDQRAALLLGGRPRRWPERTRRSRSWTASARRPRAAACRRAPARWAGGQGAGGPGHGVGQNVALDLELHRSCLLSGCPGLSRYDDSPARCLPGSWSLILKIQSSSSHRVGGFWGQPGLSQVTGVARVSTAAVIWRGPAAAAVWTRGALRPDAPVTPRSTGVFLWMSQALSTALIHSLCALIVQPGAGMRSLHRPRCSPGQRLLLDPVGELGDLVVDRAAFGHQRPDLACRRA